MLNYRRANIEDIDALRQLAVVAYGQYSPLLEREHAERLLANVDKPETWQEILAVADAFLCTNESAVVGMAFLIPSGNPWEMFLAEWCYIRMVGVNPAYEGNGIAKALTQQCIDAAKERGEKTIALHTSEMMPAARHIYEKFGFTILRELPLRLGKRYWLYTLEL